MLVNLNNINIQIRRFAVNKLNNCKYTLKMHENEDNRLETFRRICDEIATERSYLNKSKILQDFLKKGSDKQSFKGDTLLWIQMLLPSTSQRVYNLQNKQMLKLFSRLFNCNQQDMQLDLEQEGDVSETLRKFFENSSKLRPKSQSKLYLQDVDEFLLQLEQKTKEDEQTEALRLLCKQTTADDLKMIIRMIKQDLRIHAKASHILDAFGPLAYPAYQSSRDLAAVVEQFSKKTGAAAVTSNKATNKAAAKPTKKTNGKISQVSVMTPISPMLANACKSVDDAFKKCSGGMFSEIKYDGERVQIHKSGNEFKFFSRNLKPVMDHKVKRFTEFIPKAFPGGGDLILDSEIIMVDTVTGALLPFGTLGAHKKKEQANAEVCLFVFDCILYDGEDLTNLTCRERRKILEENIKPIKSHVQLSESHFLKTKNELSLMTAKVLRANLEGVVLKDPAGKYQPGKRGWLKVKKDYLFDGKMADTADLVVLGASFGSGKKGGILSIFLMGCYDRRDHLWKTVTKVHTGLDDATMDEMHEKLMALMERADPNRLPNWLHCKKSLIPDYIAKSPKTMPVWEITGAEYTKSEAHTAAGISIRFPRITRLRDDKSAEQANDLEYLQKMYEASKNNVNVDLLMKDTDADAETDVKISSKLNFFGATPNKRKSTEQAEAAVTSSSSKKMKTEWRSDDEDMEEVKPKPAAQKKTSPAQNKRNALKTKNEKQLKLCFNPINKVDKIKTENVEIATKVKKENEANIEAANVKEEKVNIKAPKRENENIKDVEMKKSKTKTAKTEAIELHKVALDKVPKVSDIFKHVTAYFAEPTENAADMQLFSSHGGHITNDTKQATIALYANAEATVKLDFCRQMYRKTCRHLSVDWVRDSATAKKCAEFPIYAVLLK